MIDKIKHKTIGYLFERYIGIIFAIIACLILLSFWSEMVLLLSDKYFDSVLKVSTSLFGFLLTVLSLLINGKNEMLEEMRKHNSFVRLVSYHKKVIFLLFIILLLSIGLFIITSSQDKLVGLSVLSTYVSYKIIVSIHFFLTIWVSVDILIFVSIFYKLISIPPK